MPAGYYRALPHGTGFDTVEDEPTHTVSCAARGGEDSQTSHRPVQHALPRTASLRYWRSVRPSRAVSCGWRRLKPMCACLTA